MWTRMRTMCTSHSNFGIVVCCCANSGKATEHRWKNNSGFSCNRERQQKQWHTHWNRFCSALDFCSCLSLSCVGVWSSEPLTDTWLNLPLCLFFSFFRQNIHQKTHLRDKFAYDKRPFCCLLLRAIFFFFFGVSFLLVAGFSVFLVHIERVVALTVRGCGTQSWIWAEFGWTFLAAHGVNVWNWCRRVFWFLVKHKQWKNNNKMVLRMKMYF